MSIHKLSRSIKIIQLAHGKGPSKPKKNLVKKLKN